MKLSDRPLVGILTSLKGKQTIAGNIPLFREIQVELEKYGEQSIVFDSNYVYHDLVKGVIFQPKENRWTTVTSPLPQIVYNRIPFRSVERSQSYMRMRDLFDQHAIPMVNPGFIDKFDMYQLFKLIPSLQEFFLPTIKIANQAALFTFLKEHKKIYVKRTQSSKGRGIHQLSLLDSRLTVTTIHDTITYPSFDRYWESFESTFLLGYIAQPAIDSVTHQGRRYDLRVLAVYNGSEHLPAGIGVRQSGEQQVTTHVPSGGSILPYDWIRTTETDTFVRRIVKECGRVVSEAWGLFVEFSLDLGRTESGRWVIYEINAKPMKFDEVEIEVARIQQLTQLFLQSKTHPLTI